MKRSGMPQLGHLTGIGHKDTAQNSLSNPQTGI